MHDEPDTSIITTFDDKHPLTPAMSFEDIEERDGELSGLFSWVSRLICGRLRCAFVVECLAVV